MLSMSTEGYANSNKKHSHFGHTENISEISLTLCSDFRQRFNSRNREIYGEEKGCVEEL